MNNSMVFSYAARLRKMGNDYILSELGNAGLVDIVPSHGEILLYLLEAGTLRMGELTPAKSGAQNPQSPCSWPNSRAPGYVERRPDLADSRSTLVSLTEKGQSLRPAFEAISDGLDNMLRQRLSDGELAELSSYSKSCQLTASFLYNK